MADDVDPLAATGPERDGLGRPKIIPLKDGEPNLEGKLVAYTRASTFAKAISSAGGLTDWKVRHAVVGVAISPDLAAMAGALGRNPDDFTAAQKRDLDEIIETAHDRSGGNAKANYGTAVHSLTEPDNAGVAAAIPDMAGDVDAYKEALDRHGIEVVDSEIFVVHDELKVAGTYDHRYLATRPLALEDGSVIPPDSLLLGDKKTGTLHFDEHAIQLAIYANGEQYDWETGVRTPLGVLHTFGILAHIGRGAAQCDLYLVDLTVGWHGVKLCEQVRTYRLTRLKKSQPLTSVSPIVDVEPVSVVDEPSTAIREAADAPERIADPFDDAVERITEAFDATPVVEPDPILRDIASATTPEALRHVWSTHRRKWSNKYTEASKTRIAEIEAA